MDGQPLRSAIPKVLQQWEGEVRARCPSARDKSHFALQDHLPLFLQTVATALDTHETVANEEVQKNLSRVHGHQRAQLDDYSLGEVLEEYRILRKTLKNFLHQTKATPESFDLVDDLIDQAMVRAGTKFSEDREAQVESSMKKFEATNRDLEQFAAIAAHDLRSPMATISGYVSLLKEELTESTGMVQQSLDFIASASQRMLILIERLLEYSKIGKTEIQKNPVDLNEILRNTLANLEAFIQETKAQFLYRNLPTVIGDEALLGQLFQNLIANSLKFRGHLPPVIRITELEETEDHWLITVADNGIGFDADQAETIFEPFKRLHSKKEYQGSGLGLSTCRRVVELHGGRIWGESQQGHGSTFYFTVSKQS